MKTKKLLALTLAAVLACSLTGCGLFGGKDPAPQQQPSTSTEQPSTTNQTEDPKEENTEDPETTAPTGLPDDIKEYDESGNLIDNETETGSSTVMEEIFLPTISEDEKIDPTAMMDTNNIHVEAESIVVDNYLGKGIKLNIKNETGKTILVLFEDMKINGIAVTNDFFANVKTDESITTVLYPNWTSVGQNIGVITDITTDIIVRDKNTRQVLGTVEDFQLKTSQYGSTIETTPSGETVLYNQNGVKLTGKIAKNTENKDVVQITADNSGTNNIFVSMGYLYLNDTEIMNPSFAMELAPGTANVLDVQLSQADKDSGKYDAIQSAKLVLRITNKDTNELFGETEEFILQN